MPSLLPSGVSVVIPVKDDSAALVQCLDALALQSRAPDEVIVVDNGSADDSAAIARRWGARVVPESEPGIPAASSTGYDAARFAVIARLDADSVPPPEWIETGLALLGARPDLAGVTGPGSFYDGPRWGAPAVARAYLGAYFGSVRLAIGVTPLFGSAFFLRTWAWQAVAPSVHRRGTTLHDDLDLSIHLGTEHPVELAPSLSVGISFRPFTQWRTLAFRFYRGFVTLAVHWPADSAMLRSSRRIRHRARRILEPSR